jgi:hypothetical protein
MTSLAEYNLNYSGERCRKESLGKTAKPDEENEEKV